MFACAAQRVAAFATTPARAAMRVSAGAPVTAARRAVWTEPTALQRPAFASQGALQKSKTLQKHYNRNVLTSAAIAAKLGGSDAEAFLAARDRGVAPPEELLGPIAEIVRDWALSRGATHYTHVFQPLSRSVSEKHDSFLKLPDGSSDGHAIMKFSGSDLSAGEADGSSFPNGGLRETSRARAHVVWDSQSPLYLQDHGNGVTLKIPAVFFSWDGHVLDRKLPLLRSEAAVKRSVLRLLGAAEGKGDGSSSRHTRANVFTGLEQEFFLVEKSLFDRRLDLRTCGRTLLGADAVKDQGHSDKYYARGTSQMMSTMHAAEMELWKLGIPQQTRHREVAPAQYEFAPQYMSCSVASDRNMLLVDVLQETARRFGVEVLVHEKPFAGVNGSGKHNNYSLGTNVSPLLFKPSKDNPNFFLIMAGLVRAVDLHADLIRASVADAGNDHRLGGHEAPPAIVSIYFGAEISRAVECIMKGDDVPAALEEVTVDLGAPSCPPFHRPVTDRNRTSPLAFVSDRIEIRSVGSSHNPADSSTTINTILADSFAYLAEQLESGRDVADLVRATFVQHSRVLFEGDNYADAWVEEAARRGLPNLRNTPAALEQLDNPKNAALFAAMGVLSSEDFAARASALKEQYCNDIETEAKTVLRMCRTQILPAALDNQTKQAGALAVAAAAGVDASAQKLPLERITAHLGQLIAACDQVERLLGADKPAALNERMHFFADDVMPVMEQVRAAADALETLCGAEGWPIPTYDELLHRGH